jgi:hypothetical protein
MNLKAKQQLPATTLRRKAMSEERKKDKFCYPCPKVETYWRNDKKASCKKWGSDLEFHINAGAGHPEKGFMRERFCIEEGSKESFLIKSNLKVNPFI